jgi:hypothetical protein
MPPLPRELRKSLESTVVAARAAAEDAARAALATLAVDKEKPFEGMDEGKRALRRALRAKERQLGSYEALVSEIAYQHWHRMLFARFLAENGLLIHPDAGVGVSLEEVTDLAREEGEPDPWVLAARYAAQMLPAIFREHDPVLELALAVEGRRRLEVLLAGLPRPVFMSDDALGWVYQFWQSEKKKQVNNSGDKIGAAELPAVTQLFTEDYMVRFLLENSLGAWWAARHPDSPLLERLTYLRLTDDGTPVAGMFEDWPKSVAEVTVIDPCCGSGHFLTVASEMLTAMRTEEEGLSAREAGDVVIAENLFGLELDPRCTQIAAFALALTVWRSGGYRKLPAPNIACSGIGVAGQLSEWKKLAKGDEALENALMELHEQFRNAPELGSLIDPRRATEAGHMFSVDYERVAPLLEELLSRESDPETQVAGWAAAGIAHAGSLLARTYTLVSTNVPYLVRRKQSQVLRAHCELHFSEGSADLATSFLERLLTTTQDGGAVACVLPQNWMYLKSYQDLRLRLVKEEHVRLLIRLGEHAFWTTAAAGAFPCLLVASHEAASPTSTFCVGDLSSLDGVEAKAVGVREESLGRVALGDVASSPGTVFGVEASHGASRLEDFAGSFQGISTGDGPRFIRRFWELESLGSDWERELSSPDEHALYSGRYAVVFWERDAGVLRSEHQATRARIRGIAAWGKPGVAVGQMRELPATLYSGELFDNNAAAIVPHRLEHLSALWAYVTDGAFHDAVRALSPKISVEVATLLKIPFDLEHWTTVAEELYPDGLPEPYSSDPTQWLFKGDPADATEPLQAAVARLLGYRWPDQEPDELDQLADADGVIAIPAVAGDGPAAGRLRVLVERAWGDSWSPGKLDELLAGAGSAGKDLETWLRDSFFASHAKLFHNRPFIWHIWDGRKDGFGVLVNYHRLDRQLLDRITHSLLGAWIQTQRDQVQRGVAGAEPRLIAAQDLQRMLELIAEGEKPYDVYVRWKPLSAQPIGWHPDLNDGVRLNIRPFVTAGVLRSKFSVNWNKDRGKDPDGSDRLNDLHFALAEKQEAREARNRR